MKICLVGGCRGWLDPRGVFDNPHKALAYNLYSCKVCGTVHIYNVWSNKGVITVNPLTAKVTEEKENGKF